MKKENIKALLNDIKLNGLTANNYKEIEKMINEIDAEIRKEINKKAGCADLEKAANNIIKLAKKKSPGARGLHGAWITKSGCQYVCDGHHAIKIYDPIKLEEITVENTMNIDQLFNVSDFPERFALPGVAELKSMIKEAKQAAKLAGRKTRGIVLALENGPVFNADYLLNTIMATGAEYIETQKANKQGKYTAPGFCFSDAAAAIICPINSEPKNKMCCYPIYL